MTRGAVRVLALIATALFVAGCNEKKPPESDMQSSTASGDVLAPDAGYNDPYGTYDSGATYGGSGDSGAATSGYDSGYSAGTSGGSSGGGTMYVVKRKDTLYSIARAHYNGDASKWRLIYEANRDKIQDPNKIFVGTKLVIPSAY